MQDFSKNNPLLKMVNNWAKCMQPMSFQQFIKRLHNMDEYLEGECCDKAEKIDREVLDIDSDKFDIDVWKVFTREKLMRQKERAEKEKACKEVLKEIKEDIGYKDEDDDRKSLCTESWLSKEELEKYKKRYKDIRDEQDLIMSSLINLSFPNDFMKGSYVQQYKQLEAQKMIVVDTIMNSYGGSQSAGHHLWNDNLTEKNQNTVYADVR